MRFSNRLPAEKKIFIGKEWLEGAVSSRPLNSQFGEAKFIPIIRMKFQFDSVEAFYIGSLL
jgi:hypothetical protein